MPASGASKKSSPKKRKPKASTTAPAENSPDARAGVAADTRTSKKPAVPELAPGELPLVSDGAIVLDGYSGRPLYEKNADQPLYPASTTKIMTALLVIEAGNLDQEVEVTLEDSKVGESSLNIKPGDRFTRRQALYGLMLKSANDIAHMLGRDNAGSIEAFAEKMTRRAQELGAMNTHFQNPHGLHNVEHYTTPRDLALIARAAMQQPLFRQIVGTVSHPWVSPTVGTWQLANHNRLLREFPGCTGVKTGFTNPAQHTLASAALWGNDEMICVVMHSTKQGKWDDSKMLITYGFEHRSDPPPTSITAMGK
ncbi:D-alanyl-D-alanine carboxypeptidase family protein [Verrucomicrobiota bacterium sgz303538]